MSEFKRKKISELKKMQLEAVEQYYLELRKYEYENSIPLKNINLRKKIHSLLVQIIKIDRILSKEELTTMKDERIKTTSPKIYACTHVGGNDIQRVFEAIKESAYLFLGDPKEVYRDLTGLILHLNGAICLETDNKIDRNIAYERSLELLTKGGNLLIFPEGAWNIFENLPVMKLYPGVAKMAKNTEADIIPVAIEQYENKFIVNIGRNMENGLLKEMSVKEINIALRDTLASLKWDIWEQNGIEYRKNISEDLINNFRQNIVDRCEYDFSIQDVYDTMYKDKTETSPEEAYIVSPKRQYELVKKYSN